MNSQRSDGVNPVSSKALGFLSGLISDGPWRSKSVLVALVGVVAGAAFWLSDFKHFSAERQSNNVATNAPGIASSNTSVAPADSHRSDRKLFPWYAKMCASYVAGFCMGWFFRKLVRLILIVTALAIALVAFGRFAGCDTAQTQEQVKRGSEWAQRETTATKDYLKHLLPSATAGGVGAFLGFRRRGKAGTPEPANQDFSAGPGNR